MSKTVSETCARWWRFGAVSETWGLAFKFGFRMTLKIVMVVTHLVELWLPTSEICGSNPIVVNFYLLSTVCQRRKQRKKESRHVSYERTLTKNSVKLKGKSVDSCLRLNEARQCTKDVPLGVQQFQGGFKYFNSNHQCDLIWHVFEDSFRR